MKLKRLFSALAAVALTVTLLPAAHAADPDVAGMTQILAALDIMTGSETGDFMLERKVTRAEFTKLIIAASPLGQSVGAATAVSPYPDVPYTHWAAPYVEAAVAAGYVNGYLDGTFHPDEDITLAMGVTMAVRLLGYSDGDFSGAWPAGQMTLYHNLDLDEGVTAGQNDPMTRQDAMYLLYNLLTAPTRAGMVYLNTLGFSLTPAGEIDRVAVINAAMDGPLVADGGWTGRLGFDPTVNTTVYRGGNLSTLAAIQTGDVVYYSKSMRTLWAYTTKVTGLYQAVSPSASSPSAVTVAGRTYAIETADAAYALSNLGSYKTGDTVTLLLGRNGGVAAVADSNSVNGSLVGVVAAVSDSPYTDANGNQYTAKTATFTATDGGVYSYPVEATSSLKAGSLVQVTLTGGEARLTRLNQSSTSGKVSAGGDKLGSVPFAVDAELLDVNGDGLAVKVYPSRLAGLTLDSGDVKYVRKNAAGEIDILILNDFTWDLYSYGVLTSVTEVDAGMAAMAGAYLYDVGGQTYLHQTTSSVLNLSVGPVRIEGPLQAPSKLAKLDWARLASVDALTAVTEDNASLPVSSSVAVYELEDNTYRLSSLERVRTGYSLTGYYDRPAGEGGCVRVIVAKAK